MVETSSPTLPPDHASFVVPASLGTFQIACTAVRFVVGLHKPRDSFLVVPIKKYYHRTLGEVSVSPVRKLSELQTLPLTAYSKALYVHKLKSVPSNLPRPTPHQS